MGLSKGGLIGCAIYAGICIVLVGFQFYVADPKTSAFLGAIAISPAGILFYLFGLSRYVPDAALLGGYSLLAPSFLIAYCVGWAIGALARWMERLDE